MIELKNDNLVFSFPNVHPEATVSVNLQVTLRIPDDGKEYSLPPGFGSFPMRRVDDLGDKAPAAMREKGGVIIPLWQSQALWISFRTNHPSDRDSAFPVAMKVAAGKINAITGKPYAAGLLADDHLTLPPQPWLDGFKVDPNVDTIRQFVAAPLGSGYTVEGQLTGEETVGGLQLEVFPMKGSEFETRFPKVARTRSATRGGLECFTLGATPKGAMRSAGPQSMGLAAGGRMKQKIHADPFGLSVWDLSSSASESRIFIHLVNSRDWEALTGTKPPLPPITADQYARARLPWFQHYADDSAAPSIGGFTAPVKSFAELDAGKAVPLVPDNVSVDQGPVLKVGKPVPSPDAVRDGKW